MVIWKNYVSEEAMYHCCSFVTSCASIVLYPFHIFNSLYLSKAYSCDNLSFFITSFALFFSDELSCANHELVRKPRVIWES